MPPDQFGQIEQGISRIFFFHFPTCKLEVLSIIFIMKTYKIFDIHGGRVLYAYKSYISISKYNKLLSYNQKVII